MYDILNNANSYINEDFMRVTEQLWKGFGVTLSLFFLTLILAIPLGLIFAFCTRSSFLPLKLPFRAFVYVIRGTPLLLQLMIVIYIPGIAFHAPITKWSMFGGNVATAYFFGALFAFVINYACYFSEIFRGGIENIPKGQYEACDVLGMTRSEAFFKVILLQVIRNILAPMSNEIITLVKDTALARTVAVTEILFCAYEFLKVDAIIWPLFYTGLFYLVFNAVLTWLFGLVEKRLSRYYK